MGFGDVAWTGEGAGLGTGAGTAFTGAGTALTATGTALTGVGGAGLGCGRATGTGAFCAMGLAMGRPPRCIVRIKRSSSRFKASSDISF